MSSPSVSSPSREVSSSGDPDVLALHLSLDRLNSSRSRRDSILAGDVAARYRSEFRPMKWLLRIVGIYLFQSKSEFRTGFILSWIYRGLLFLSASWYILGVIIQIIVRLASPESIPFIVLGWTEFAFLPPSGFSSAIMLTVAPSLCWIVMYMYRRSPHWVEVLDRSFEGLCSRTTADIVVKQTNRAWIETAVLCCLGAVLQFVSPGYRIFARSKSDGFIATDIILHIFFNFFAFLSVCCCNMMFSTVVSIHLLDLSNLESQFDQCLSMKKSNDPTRNRITFLRLMRRHVSLQVELEQSSEQIQWLWVVPFFSALIGLLLGVASIYADPNAEGWLALGFGFMFLVPSSITGIEGVLLGTKLQDIVSKVELAYIAWSFEDVPREFHALSDEPSVDLTTITEFSNPLQFLLLSSAVENSGFIKNSQASRHIPPPNIPLPPLPHGHSSPSARFIPSADNLPPLPSPEILNANVNGDHHPSPPGSFELSIQEQRLRGHSTFGFESTGIRTSVGQFMEKAMTSSLTSSEVFDSLENWHESFAFFSYFVFSQLRNTSGFRILGRPFHWKFLLSLYSLILSAFTLLLQRSV